ncbi:hypothetical protein G7Z17_g1251 [Cylindrodendrum hubeiense]|uniref:Methyltransferase n=1 Tax=Cylindrodendrum hubeiense TaxID=595255 RepID=A0A9P5LCQ1_9HYPO|nr:hypothetical protein G7Z17_g1251 [Cylindrodendrum hubeiense]
MQDQREVVVEPDNFNDRDSALGDTTDGESSTASLNSSILDYRRENGRTYHKFHDGQYHFPNDEAENERLDMQHHIFYLTLNGKLGLAPPNEANFKLGRVLDLGTGTGIWAMDFGEEHPEAEIDDFEEEWTYSKPFDYIHSRMNNSSISNWEEYIRKSFDHLAPGGYVEFQEFTLPLSDDGTLTENHALYKAMHHLGEAAAKLNHSFIDLNTIKPMLEKAGFRDIHEYHYKWASNTWPRDAHFKEVGAWNYQNIVTGLQGFLMAALTRGLGWKAEEVDVLAAEAKRNMRDRRVHAYWPMIVVTGRKPEAKGE